MHQAAGSSSRKNNKYRFVVDTSVLVSALFFGGKEQQVLLHVTQHHSMIVSDYIIDELLDFAKHTLPKTPRRTIVAIRQALEPFAREQGDHAVEIRDINDVPILQLAIEHGAAVISSDKDLLTYKDSARAAVLSVAEYEELFLGK